MADLQALIKSRGGKLGVCTKKVNEMRTLMETHADDETINEKFDELRRAMNEFYDAHVSVQACMIEEEEKEKDQTEWYEPKMAVFDSFCTEMNEWKEGQLETQPQINPEDSASKAGSKTSKASAVSSLRAKAAAEKAALEAKSRGMKLQHELQEEKEKLQRKMEQLDLDIKLSEADAKLQVYESFEMASAEQLYSHDILQPLQGDAMNAYAESYADKSVVMAEQSPVEFIRLGTIPKTPLQRIMKEEAKQTRIITTSQTNNMPTETALSTPGQTTTQIPIQQPTPVPRTAPPQRTIQTQLPLQAPAIININRPSLSSLRMGQPNTPPQPVQPNDSQLAQPNSPSNPVNAQSELASLIIQHQKQTSLPTRELPTFNGDLISYLPFIHAFENRIEQMTANDQERLFFLEQYTTGQPKELVQSCLHLDAQLGYAEARRLLNEYFGDPYRLSTAYIQKALNWNAIKPEDGKELYSYALYLRSCCNIISSLPDMSELDTPSNLQLILSKLPYKLRERWRSKACEIQEQTKRRARFHNIVAFLEKQAKVLLDPVFGTIQDSVSKAAAVAKTTGQKRPPPKKSFATTVVPMVPVATHRGGSASESTSESLPQKRSQMAYTKPCFFCKGHHTMESCHQMALQQHKEKVEFLRRNGMCFACLTKGHVSSGCTRRLTCRICQKKHPSILHIEGPVKSHSQPHATNSSPVTQSACTVNNTPPTDTGAGVSDCKLAIIPVKIRSTKSNKAILTYAFLDPGSSASFGTQRLMEDLHMQGKSTEILLRTMGQERVIKTQRVTGLEVSSCHESDFIQLPEVFTQDRIPVCHGNITREEDIQRWPYLHDVQLPAIDADIGLLIGANAPWALEPWSVIHSQGDGPCAVKCRLGWLVQGPLNGGAPTDEHSHQCVSSNRISVARLEELLVSQYNQDFPERTCQEQAELSFEDKKFLKIADESATKKGGHYEMRLPFRNENLVMPNNKPVAELRAATLQRKLKRNDDFRTDYTTFMDAMLDNGYAEKVPDDQLSRSDGRVWYIPHHAVYHKKKNKVRVVFDCTASFQGTSLNLQLLQGPDLTNTLLGVILRFRQEQVAMMADIEGMFHQVRVPSNDVDFLRFLWWPNGDVHQPLAEYRMVVHLFGAVSSPSCANYALKRTAKDNEGVMNPEVLETIRRNFYVDDLLKSVASEEQAIHLVSNLKTTCATGGFRLTKWVSSCQSVLASIPEEDRASKER